MRFRRFVRQLHRWLGLLIGVQLLFWMSGGLIMSALSLEEVRGEHRKNPAVRKALPPMAPRVGLDAVLLRYAGERPSAVTLTRLLDQPVFRLDAPGGALLVDAVSGARLSPLARASAEAIARADYRGEAAIAGVDWVDTPALEYRGRALPLWRVRFDDADHTALYVSPQSGEVVARRNDLWRVFDFVWMLHIMDYQERDNFNHPLLIAFAASALLFTLSGGVMLWYSHRPRRR